MRTRNQVQAVSHPFWESGYTLSLCLVVLVWIAFRLEYIFSCAWADSFYRYLTTSSSNNFDAMLNMYLLSFSSISANFLSVHNVLCCAVFFLPLYFCLNITLMYINTYKTYLCPLHLSCLVAVLFSTCVYHHVCVIPNAQVYVEIYIHCIHTCICAY